MTLSGSKKTMNIITRKNINTRKNNTNFIA